MKVKYFVILHIILLKHAALIMTSFLVSLAKLNLQKYPKYPWTI